MVYELYGNCFFALWNSILVERCIIMISLIVPCLNEESAIPSFYEELMKVQESLDEIEIIFVDDGSTDKTIKVIKKLQEKDSRVHFISFSRNFGKEAAMLAGLEYSKGDYVVTMDVDLQDPPSLLPEMYRALIDSESEYDCVATRRKDRKGESMIRSFFSRCFYKLIGYFSSTPIIDGARDYRFMSRKMVDAVINDREYNRFSKGLYSWVGFNTLWLEYENIERSTGTTKWSLWTLFKYSVEGILAYSTVPLSVISFIGIVTFFLAFIGLIVVFVRALLFGDPVAGWPSLVCIITLLGGLILLCLGIIGLYLSKIYLETKKRQIYIVKDQG